MKCFRSSTARGEDGRDGKDGKDLGIRGGGVLSMGLG
jgi:hypothetical protein